MSLQSSQHVHDDSEQLSRLSADESPRNAGTLGLEHLQSHVIGSSGVKLLSQSETLLVESSAKTKLQAWLSRDGRQQVLWVSSSFEPQYLSTARIASLAVVATARSLDAPLISHFCEKPRRDSETRAKDSEKIGLIGLVYSLILQLVRLGSETSKLTINDKRLDKLDGTMESWPLSLSLLGDLLQTITCLQYCVIHGLNDLESAEGYDWCLELLNILLKYQPDGYSLLFSTTGQSRVLSKSIQFTNRYSLIKAKGEVQKRGKRLDSYTKMSSH
jgi:hypothetical protein